MSSIYDLHCHSDQSDGILSPQALVSRAKSQNVAVLALTDHDTTSGLSAARAQADADGIEFIDGVEFSCQWRGCNIHILGLNIDPQAPSLRSAIMAQAERRETRARRIGEKLAALGLPQTYQGARACAGSGVLGRPHFAQYLVACGHCKDTAEAFKKYLGHGKPGDVKQFWPSIEDIVAVIVAAGGVAVLAHPHKYKMTRTRLCAMVAHFKTSGGVAMELVSGQQTAQITDNLVQIARKYQLLASCGSDFHRPGLPWQELGAAAALPPQVTPVWSLWT